MVVYPGAWTGHRHTDASQMYFSEDSQKIKAVFRYLQVDWTRVWVWSSRYLNFGKRAIFVVLPPSSVTCLWIQPIIIPSICKVQTLDLSLVLF